MTNITDTPATEGDAMTTTMAKVTEHDHNGLNATQRCDRCGAQAYLVAEMPPTTRDADLVDPVDGKVLQPSGSLAVVELLFCAKHGTENMGKLLATAVAIQDYRKALQQD